MPDSTLAKGWNLSIHHRFDGERLFKGDGAIQSNLSISYDNDDTLIQEETLTYRFDAQLRHSETTDTLSGGKPQVNPAMRTAIRSLNKA